MLTGYFFGVRFIYINETAIRGERMNAKKDSSENKNRRIHSISLESRSKAVISGVTDTDKFTENSVLLYTDMGELTVKGRNLRVTLLSVESGDMEIEGEISALIYGDSQVRSPLSFMGRLMK